MKSNHSDSNVKVQGVGLFMLTSKIAAYGLRRDPVGCGGVGGPASIRRRRISGRRNSSSASEKSLPPVG